jgi:hypothetical protein
MRAKRHLDELKQQLERELLVQLCADLTTGTYRKFVPLDDVVRFISREGNRLRSITLTGKEEA